ncbi:MAG: hypothetical protein HQ478_05190 [Chloroflexi bacterium]|nr:hypothetical protein [Chloroflexota bacterium]
MQISDLLSRIGIDKESTLALAYALGAVLSGLLGAWVGGGPGLIIFLIVFVPIVFLALRNAAPRSTRRRR